MMYTDYDIYYKEVTYESAHKLIELTDGDEEFKHFLDIDYQGSKYRGSVGIKFPRYAYDKVEVKVKAVKLIAETLVPYM